MTGLLVVYALRNTPILTGSHGLPELIACTVIVLLHVWKRSMLLSIAGRHDRIHATGAAGVLRLGSASPSLISPSGRLRRPPPSVREVLNAAKRR